METTINKELKLELVQLDQNITPSSSSRPSTLSQKKKGNRISSVDPFRLGNFLCFLAYILLFIKIVCFSSGRDFLHINWCGCLNLSRVSDSFGRKVAI